MSTTDSGVLPDVSSEVNNKLISDEDLLELPSLNHFNLKTGLANTESLVSPMNQSMLTSWDKIIIKYYSDKGYISINGYLQPGRTSQLPKLPKNIYSVFNTKFSVTPTNFLQQYYYYFLNLYNAIQKYPSVAKPFIVIRGSLTQYLPTDTSRSYYFNSFTSTTTNDKIAKGFGGFLYIFYVHPLCQYMNIESASSIKGEKEILFNPYNKIIFVKEDGKSQIFIVLPTDLEIPSTYKDFITWKNTHFSTTSTKGGRVQEPIVYNMMNSNKNSILVNSRKNLKLLVPSRMNKTSKNKNRGAMESIQKNTTRTNKNKNEISKEFIERITDPIATFPGKAPTDVEKKVIAAMVKYFEG